MAAFDPDAEMTGDLAFLLLRDTAVTLFRRPEVLAETTAWQAARGYQLVTLDAAEWISEDDLHDSMAAALRFPDYYGRNLNALNDCLRDVVSQDYGWAPDATGLVVVLTHYDVFTERCRYPAQAVLDLFADHSRQAALIGRRLICLVHSDDPDISFEPVGATAVTWHSAEWLDAQRRS